ncbi:Protein Star [Folsomia candida]|uniref:Protein Star n=1 Tax=Folsomia candida TaxID=158441 RepID=A0A226D464_FOLCA|nr:Protein Star [Folsomia candida]
MKYRLHFKNILLGILITFGFVGVLVNYSSSSNQHVNIQDELSELYLEHKVLVTPSHGNDVVVSATNPHKEPEQQEEIYRYVFNLLGEKKNGFFIECGANDGEMYSNTLPLELRHGWTGLLVEPDPVPLSKLLVRNRNVWIAPVCLSGQPWPTKVGMTRPKEDDLMTHVALGKLTSFTADCYPLFTLLKAINVDTIDYFSLDIEGAELPVLKTIPWDRVLIKFIATFQQGHTYILTMANKISLVLPLLVFLLTSPHYFATACTCSPPRDIPNTSTSFMADPTLKVLKCSNCSEIPTYHDPSSITKLDLSSGAKLTHLTANIFVNKGFFNLKEINLSNCEIEDVDTDAFLGIKNFRDVNLDLSYNYTPRQKFKGTHNMVISIDTLNRCG